MVDELLDIVTNEDIVTGQEMQSGSKLRNIVSVYMNKKDLREILNP